MEDEERRCSKVPFIFAIVPVVLIGGLIGFVAFVSPDTFRPGGDCFGGLGGALILLCGGFPIALLTGTLGITSIVSGIDALKEPAAKGRKLVVVAIILGILEIAIFTVVFGITVRSCTKIRSRRGVKAPTQNTVLAGAMEPEGDAGLGRV